VAETKLFSISKREVWEAYERVKANRGAAGVDGQSLAAFEMDLKGNLYKIWNRMSSGSYLPPPVRLVEIPKGDGRMRPLGIPTVGDRVAQTVAKTVLEAKVEPKLHPDSYGYRRAMFEPHRFDFLGYTFQPRRPKNRHGKFFVSFLPAISNKAAMAVRQTIRDWRLAFSRNNQTLADLARLTDPYVRGWINCYGRFYRSRCVLVLRYLNDTLVRWAMRKYRRFRRRERAAVHWLGRIAERNSGLFALWRLGIKPAAGQ
jgi:RNA-directed DNA polymerase